MQVLINDLLAFSRVGRQGDAMETVDLNRLVDRAAENVAGALEESGGAVEHGDLPRVHGAPVLLTTVFQNLLGNSLKFRGEDPPRVRVDAERDGDRWLLRFRDNGIGIDPEYAERIFVIFQRLHAAEHLSRHRDRAGHVPEDPRAPRRLDVARHATPRPAPPSSWPCPS